MRRLAETVACTEYIQAKAAKKKGSHCANEKKVALDVGEVHELTDC